MIRSIAVALIAGISMAVLGTIAIVGAYLRLPRGYYLWAGRFWSRLILRSAGTPVRVIGREHLTDESPQIIAVNHQSMFDVFAVTAHCPERYHYVAKKELGRIPVFGRASRAAGHVFIDRGHRKSAIESLKLAGRRLHELDSTAVVFPEGTRSLTGDLQPFKKGPFIMAIESGLPIVPTVVDGTLEILPKRGLRIRPNPITVWFGEPIETRGYGYEQREALMARVHAVMAEMLATLREPPGYTGPRRLTPESEPEAAATAGAPARAGDDGGG